MSYRLDPGAPLPEDLSRVCDAQAGKAVAALTERPDGLAEAVHDARKACKRLRAVLRLARPALGDAYGRENARYRDAAALLSELRDADALLESAAGLRDRLGTAVKAPLFNHLRKALQARREARYAAAGDAEALCGKVADRIDGGRAVLKELAFPDRPEPLVAGLRKTYKRGRKAYRACREAQDLDVAEGAETFHDWRKRVKYHGYHLRLTASVWPQEAKLQRKVDELDVYERTLQAMRLYSDKRWGVKLNVHVVSTAMEAEGEDKASEEEAWLRLPLGEWFEEEIVQKGKFFDVVRR